MKAFLALSLAAAIVGVAYAQAPARGAGPGQTPGQTPPAGGRGAGYLKLFDSNQPFDAHDLAGIWTPNGNGFGGGGRCRDCGDRGYSFEFPTFTPAGQAAFSRNIPSYGRAAGSADANAHPEEHIGRRRAQPPALGNDTYGTCNPMGMPRAILYPDPVEFIVLPDRIYQHFEWGYGLRTVWMDEFPCWSKCRTPYLRRYDNTAPNEDASDKLAQSMPHLLRRVVVPSHSATV